MKYLILLVLLFIPKYAITPLSPKASLHVFKPGQQGLIFEDIQFWTTLNVKSYTDQNTKIFAIANATAPYQNIHQTLKQNGKVIYDQDYLVREFGFRQSPEIKNSTHHLIIAGDSNVFGLGVDEDETPAYLIARKLKYHPYNFGIRGGGPHNTLAIMEFFPWEKIITESKGIFIYNYYDTLLERIIGAKGYVKWSHGKAPRYELKDSEAIYQGSLEDSILVKIYKKIAENPWLDNLLPVLPRHRDAHLQLLVRIFQKMQKLYYHNFPEGQFYVAVNYTMNEFWPNRLKILSEELKKNKINFFIIPKKINDKNDLFIDGHLNKTGHRIEAQQIYEKLIKINL